MPLFHHDDLWSLVFEATVVIVLVCHTLHPYRTVNLTGKCVCSDCSSKQPFTCLSFSLWVSLFQRNNNIELRQLITQHLPLTVQVNGRVHTLLSLNQKLKMVKLSEEDMSKSKTGWKLGFFCQAFSWIMNAKEKFLGETKGTTPVNLEWLENEITILIWWEF